MAVCFCDRHCPIRLFIRSSYYEWFGNALLEHVQEFTLESGSSSGMRLTRSDSERADFINPDPPGKIHLVLFMDLWVRTRLCPALPPDCWMRLWGETVQKDSIRRFRSVRLCGDISFLETVWRDRLEIPFERDRSPDHSPDRSKVFGSESAIPWVFEFANSESAVLITPQTKQM